MVQKLKKNFCFIERGTNIFAKCRKNHSNMSDDLNGGKEKSIIFSVDFSEIIYEIVIVYT